MILEQAKRIEYEGVSYTKSSQDMFQWHAFVEVVIIVEVY
jgi:hypothetical protein